MLHNKWNTAYEYNKLKYLYLGAFTWDVGTCIRVPIGLKMWYLTINYVSRLRSKYIDTKEIFFEASFDFALNFCMLTLSIKCIRKDIMYIGNIIFSRKLFPNGLTENINIILRVKSSLRIHPIVIWFAFTFALYFLRKDYNIMLTFGTICFVRGFVIRQLYSCD